MPVFVMAMRMAVVLMGMRVSVGIIRLRRVMRVAVICFYFERDNFLIIFLLMYMRVRMAVIMTVLVTMSILFNFMILISQIYIVHGLIYIFFNL